MSDTLKNGSKALITFEGRVGGETFENSTQFQGGTTKDGYPLIIGSNTFIGKGVDANNKEYKGFEEQLIGMKKGETKIIEVIFPAEYQADLANKPAFFKVELIDFE